MPELPEVETVRRDLSAALTGSVVTGVTVSGLRSTRRHGSGADFARALAGRRLVSFGRKGKYLVVALEPAGVLVAHLRMSGQLRVVTGAHEAMARHSHVVIDLDDGRQLRFVDPRTFGELFVTTPALPELDALGIDALDPALTVGALGSLLEGRRGGLKALLLDQRVIAGIGNIYSDEILWTARLRGSRVAGTLRAVDLRRLHEAIGGVLAAAVEGRGSSLRDQQYVDASGQAGTYQQHHAVYGRQGLACPRCGRAIERTTVSQRSHFWCRGCQ